MPSLELEPGVRLAFADRGAGPPVVLIHGWSLSSAAFDAVAADLARDRRVVVPDLRGHGGSAPAAPFALDALAGDLVALVTRLELRDVALIGWSLGAQVALAALPALRARVSRLVLLSATPRFTVGDGWPHGLPAQALEVLAHRVRRDPVRAAARFLDGLFAPGELDPAAQARVAAVRGAPPPDPAALLAGLDVLAHADLRPTLAAVDRPTLVLHGDADPICLPGAGAALAAAIPGARHVPLAGLGHAPLLSRPDAVLAAVRPFLAEAA